MPLCRCLLIALAAAGASAETVTVAVASNFAGPARAIATRFAAETGYEVRIVTGSTGKLYAQILAGAPFDVFLSADEETPARLRRDGLAVAVASYALGVLVIVSADPGLAGKSCNKALRAATGDTVAIANPETAPYGRAAKALLGSLARYAKLRVVHGDNVAQAMHFVVSGGARFGIVGPGQFHAVGKAWPGCATVLTGDDATSVLQAAAIVRRAAGARPARAFFDFLHSAPARGLIAEWGYGLPPGDA